GVEDRARDARPRAHLRERFDGLRVASRPREDPRIHSESRRRVRLARRAIERAIVEATVTRARRNPRCANALGAIDCDLEITRFRARIERVLECYPSAKANG